jgi:hypothetical protein
MACWQRNWQVTQPPASARRRRAGTEAAKTSAAATAAAAKATVTATIRAAVSKKCTVGFPKATKTTRTIAVIMLTGRA